MHLTSNGRVRVTRVLGAYSWVAELWDEEARSYRQVAQGVAQTPLGAENEGRRALDEARK